MKILALCFVSLMSLTAMAAGRDVLQAVLDSKVIQNVDDIAKVEVVTTYRCPGCYDIEVSGTNFLGSAYSKVHTEQDIQGNIQITLLEQSK
jgi:hypothetical protein